MLATSLGGKQRYAVISLSPESFRASVVARLHRAWSLARHSNISSTHLGKAMDLCFLSLCPTHR